MRVAYVERTGWSKPRKQGGTNALVDATETGRIACPACITQIQNGITPGQVSLLEDVKPSKAQRDEVWDALTEVFGKAETETARNLRGKVVRSLVAAGASRESIMERVYAWPSFFEGATLTELALEKHWGQLGTAPVMSQPLVDQKGNVTAAGMRARAEEIRRQEESELKLSPPADPTQAGGPGMPVEATASASEAPGQGGEEWPEPDEIPMEVWL